MTPLRVALLIAGAVCLALLTAWEILRVRRAAGDAAPPPQAQAPAPREPLGGSPAVSGEAVPATLLRPPLAPAPAETPPQTAAQIVAHAAPVRAPQPSIRGVSPLRRDSADAQTEFTPKTLPGSLAEPGAPGDPLVQWPPDGERVIVALRLVAIGIERFSGHLLRQALQAEGFVLGKYNIFHKPDDGGRALLSAASLTQPGSFDESMDAQPFSGLSLFAVLPGPKPPFDTFDELLACARGLNDRLQGALQDERGLPLTPLRVASLRRALQAELPT